MTVYDLFVEVVRKAKEHEEEPQVTIIDDPILLQALGLVSCTDKLADYASETDEQAYDREFMREREKEARPREQARALARYKAHCTRMTAHKARQQLRRRKYRGGANAGWW